MKDKIKQRFKKIIPYILIAVLSSTAVLFSYDKGNEVYAMVGVDDVALAGLVTAILMSYGYVTLDYYNNTDGSSALADDWEEAYEQARFQVLNGGGSGDNNDDDDDWEDTDGDGKITEKDIPKFNQLYNPTSGIVASGATFLITANAGKLLAPIVSEFIMSRYANGDTSNVECLNDASLQMQEYLDKQNIDLSSYKYLMKKFYFCEDYYEFDLYATNNGYVCETDSFFFNLIDKNSLHIFIRRTLGGGTRYDYSKVYDRSPSSTGSRNRDSFADYFLWNGPFFDNLTDAKLYESSDFSHVDWVNPDIGDGFDTKGNLELLPPPHLTDVSSYNIPTQQALQDLLNNLNNPNLLPEQQKQTLLDFINNLGNKPDPDTGKDPDKNPDPDPNPKPDPNPEPDPNPKPDPNPDVGKDTDNNSFTADLKELFPFCIPFDIVDCFRLFNAEPETPRVKFPIHFGIVDKDYTFDIDLKDFNDVAGVCRTSFLILFMVGLGFATSSVIKW